MDKQKVTKRQYELIMAVLNMEGEFLISDLSNITGIPVKTVYHEFPAVKDCLQKCDIFLEKCVNSKYAIDAGKEIIKKDKNKIIDYISSILIPDREERIKYIIFILLSRTEPLQIKEIQVKFQISKPTVLKDFQAVKDILQKKRLSVKSRTNFGTYIEGEEVHIRSAMNDFIIQNYFEQAFSIIDNVLNETNKTKYYSDTEKEINQYFSKNLMVYCTWAFNKYVQLANVAFSDKNRVISIFTIAISIKRILDGKVIDSDLRLLYGNMGLKYYEYISDAISYLEQVAGVNVPDNEKYYLMIQLVNGREQMENDEFFDTLAMCQKAADTVLDVAASYIHPKLKKNMTLRKKLKKHMLTVLNRNTNNVLVYNGLLPNIKRKYPYFYFVAGQCGRKLEEDIMKTLSEDEIGYLAIYLAAATEQYIVEKNIIRAIILNSEGSAVGWLLQVTIEHTFSNVVIEDVISIHDFLRNQNPVHYNYIISTTPLIEKIVPNVPYVVVCPLLEEEDVEKIDQGIKQIMESRNQRGKTAKNGRHKNIDLLSELTEERIQTKQTAQDWENAVDIACKILLKEQVITDSYVKAIKDNIRQYGAHMISFQEVVVLHASPRIEGIRTGVSFTTFAQPICFGDSKDPKVTSVFVLSSPDSNQLTYILEDMVALYQHEAVFSLIKEMENPEEIIETFRKILSVSEMDIDS